jgi:hypothetical protein
MSKITIDAKKNIWHSASLAEILKEVAAQIALKRYLRNIRVIIDSSGARKAVESHRSQLQLWFISFLCFINL